MTRKMNNMITPASFKIRFQEFDCSKSATIQMFIDDAVLILNEAFWGKKYDLGLYYLTAHYLSKGIATAVAKGKGQAGSMVSGRAVDGTSITYAVPAIENQDDAYYSSTAYGQRYVQLRSKLGIPAYVI